jgi:hypothetical protein
VKPDHDYGQLPGPRTKPEFSPADGTSPDLADTVEYSRIMNATELKDVRLTLLLRLQVTRRYLVRRRWICLIALVSVVCVIAPIRIGADRELALAAILVGGLAFLGADVARGFLATRDGYSLFRADDDDVYGLVIAGGGAFAGLAAAVGVGFLTERPTGWLLGLILICVISLSTFPLLNEDGQRIGRRDSRARLADRPARWSSSMYAQATPLAGELMIANGTIRWGLATGALTCLAGVLSNWGGLRGPWWTLTILVAGLAIGAAIARYADHSNVVPMG